MNNDCHDAIDFQGKKEDLLKLISCARKDSMHPFSITYVFRYEKNDFIKKGEVFNVDEQDVQEINNKNYVYCSSSCTQTKRLNPRFFTHVDAIIIGTKDESYAEKLRAKNKDKIVEYMFSVMQNISAMDT